MVVTRWSYLPRMLSTRRSCLCAGVCSRARQSSRDAAASVVEEAQDSRRSQATFDQQLWVVALLAQARAVLLAPAAILQLHLIAPAMSALLPAPYHPLHFRLRRPPRSRGHEFPYPLQSQEPRRRVGASLNAGVEFIHRRTISMPHTDHKRATAWHATARMQHSQQETKVMSESADIQEEEHPRRLCSPIEPADQQ